MLKQTVLHLIIKVTISYNQVFFTCESVNISHRKKYLGFNVNSPESAVVPWLAYVSDNLFNPLNLRPPTYKSRKGTNVNKAKKQNEQMRY